MNEFSYLPAVWPVNGPGDEQRWPLNVHAVTTLKQGGVSTGDFSEYNLAAHVGDDLPAVETNRQKLMDDLQLPANPVWLDQVHSNKVINADEKITTVQADASISRTKAVVCAVLTADCLPVFFCDQAGTEVAVAHAGWRGLHAGILSNTVKAMSSSANDIRVSFGPAIGPQAFAVGEEVFQAFVDKSRQNAVAFTATGNAHYLCDIYQLARIELRSLGVDKITGGDYCTYHENQRFYSYRRKSITGRMASLIWLS